MNAIVPPSTDPLVLTEDSEGVRVLTLSRPNKLNALNTALTIALCDALLQAGADSSVRVVILLGSGRGFCAGGDLAEFKAANFADLDAIDHRSRLISQTHEIMQSMSKPVISAVHGICYGGGAALAVAADLMIVAQGVRFSYPEIKNAIVPALVMPGLQRNVGRKVAFEMLATCPVYDAEQLVALGLANKVVAEAELRTAALEMALGMAAYDAKSLAKMKQLFYRISHLAESDAVQAARDTNSKEQLLKLAEALR
jgi:enoyl-CoA hydratase